MSSFAVFWVMVAIVWALGYLAARIHAGRGRREQQLWAQKYGPQRGGPPRAVP